MSFLQQPEMSSSASNNENNACEVASDTASDDPRRLMWVAAQEGRATDLRALLQVALATTQTLFSLLEAEEDISGC